jgi:hypothetical protein
VLKFSHSPHLENQFAKKRPHILFRGSVVVDVKLQLASAASIDVVNLFPIYRNRCVCTVMQTDAMISPMKGGSVVNKTI